MEKEIISTKSLKYVIPGEPVASEKQGFMA
jgi:hypothetical protein